MNDPLFTAWLDTFFPPTKPGTTYVRRSCGFRHWFWPTPEPGDKCLCGKTQWSGK